MNANRTLKHLFVISSSFGLALCLALLAGAPGGAATALLYSLLLPLGIACPLVSGGCLLHDRLECKKPWLALLIRLGGLGLFWAAAAFFVSRHWQ